MEILKRKDHVTVLRNGPIPPMKPTQLSVSDSKRQAMVDHLMDALGISHDLADSKVSEQLQQEAWTNGLYTCVVDRSGDYVHLSIRRVDRSPIRDWRHMQQIKNDILGPEAEGVELYPADSRLVDTANQYHLWCKLPGQQFDFGFTSRHVAPEGDSAIGVRQRKR